MQGEAYIAWKQEWPTGIREGNGGPQARSRQYVEEGMGPGLRNRLAPAHSICSMKRARTRCSACTARRNGPRSAPRASSGCIRLMNQDIIDLYARVRPGKSAKVIVQQ